MRLFFLVFLLSVSLSGVAASFSWSSFSSSLKDAHKTRVAITGGLLVAAAMVDIATASDRAVFDKNDSGLDTRSFFKRLFDRCGAICTPKKWLALSKEAARVVWARKNEKKGLLARAWQFGKNHRLVSCALFLSAANVGVSAYELWFAEKIKDPEIDPNAPKIPQIPPVDPAKNPGVSGGDPTGGNPPAGDPKKMSVELKQKIKKNLLSFPLSEVLKRKVEIAALKKSTPSPARPPAVSAPVVDPGAEPSAAASTALGQSSLGETPCGPKKTGHLKEFSPPPPPVVPHPVTPQQPKTLATPKTIGLTPGILTQNGGRKLADGVYTIELDPLLAMLEPGKRWRVAVQSLLVVGDIGGRPGDKGATSGMLLDRATVEKPFDSRKMRVENTQKRAFREELARKREEVYRKKLAAGAVQRSHSVPPSESPALPRVKSDEQDENALHDSAKLLAVLNEMPFNTPAGKLGRSRVFAQWVENASNTPGKLV